MPSLMIQGCGSDVGKSVLVAGLCRLFANRGVKVLPFKPQNMSNNAAVTAEGGEIGRAQALQALACRVQPTAEMNPVLIKPESDREAQIILAGQRAGRASAASFQARKAGLLDLVMENFRKLEARADLILVEGAGSPAEINLRPNDIANMGFARAAEMPVVLVGDIDRGHVIAALVGAKAVLDPDDAALIRGFIVNKFRGDPALFDDGRRFIVERTGWRDLGLVPWSPVIAQLPAEDAVILDRRRGKGRIAVPMFPRIANFDDFDPLGDDVVFVPPGRPLPADAVLIVLPGSKATRADLAALREFGWDIDLKAHLRRGGGVLGICGGYQMLGRVIRDPEGIEGPAGESEGLGLLDVETVLTGDKTLREVTGEIAGVPFHGYEMHLGRTTGPDSDHPLAMSRDGKVAGTYIHGLFAVGAAAAALLKRFGLDGAREDHGPKIDRALDEWAAALERHIDIDSLERLAWRRH